MYTKLMEAKMILVHYLDKIEKLDEIDYECMEYLVDTIDYLLLGKIPFNSEVMGILFEDIQVCNHFNQSVELVMVSDIISDIIKEFGLCMR